MTNCALATDSYVRGHLAQVAEIRALSKGYKSEREQKKEREGREICLCLSD